MQNRENKFKKLSSVNYINNKKWLQRKCDCLKKKKYKVLNQQKLYSNKNVLTL